MSSRWIGKILQLGDEDVDVLSLPLQGTGGNQDRGARAAARNRFQTAGRMIRLAVPVSSSRVTNVMPLAVEGRCRTSTRPATRIHLPSGHVQCGGRSDAELIQFAAEELQRMGQ